MILDQARALLNKYWENLTLVVVQECTGILSLWIGDEEQGFNVTSKPNTLKRGVANWGGGGQGVSIKFQPEAGMYWLS